MISEYRKNVNKIATTNFNRRYKNQTATLYNFINKDYEKVTK